MTTRLPVETPQSVLTLSAASCNSPDDVGSPADPRRLTYPTIEEFAEARQQVRDRLATSYVVEPGGCWRWTRSKTSSGYGHFHYQGRYYQAHRFVYAVTVGPVTTPDIDHLCRNRWCVNPRHLEPVTHAVNTRRGRGAKVTPAQVQAIRAAVRAGGSTRRVARLFGVDHSLVSRMMTGKRWSDVPERADTEAVA